MRGYFSQDSNSTVVFTFSRNKFIPNLGAIHIFVPRRRSFTQMASSTVLRVKRRLEDNPQDALVLMCKRKKLDAEEISPSLFVFRGTVKNQETSHIKDLVPKSDPKHTTSNVQDIIEKLRKEHKEQSTVSRYEVINCRRGLDTTDTEDLIDLVDLQKANDEAKDVQYAYDVYVSAKKDFDVSMLDNLVSIEHYETDLVLGPYRVNGDSSDGAEDDDDSNDENNWRNEYPDSEKSSIDEEDMVRAMERVDLADLSSDEGEDNIYDPTFTEDVTRYGASYAKYKAQVMNELPDLNDSKHLVHVSTVRDMDEESEGYKDDSDDGFYYGQDEDSEQFREQYASDHSDEYTPA